MILIICLALIILEAIHEALRDSGSKTSAGIVEWFFLIAILYGLIEINAGRIWFLIYILYRYAIFGVLYNAIRKLKLDYLGSTKIYDRVLTWIFEKIGKFAPRPHVLFMTKIIALFSAIVLTWRFRSGLMI